MKSFYIEFIKDSEKYYLIFKEMKTEYIFYDIVNTTKEHTVSIDKYTDTREIVYEFMDEYGQKLTGESKRVFIPSERK